MVRILIADDHEGTPGILRVLPQDHAGWEICGEASSNSEASQKSMKLKSDVLVKDWVMPGVRNLEVTGEIDETSSGYCNRPVFFPRPP